MYKWKKIEKNSTNSFFIHQDSISLVFQDILFIWKLRNSWYLVITQVSQFKHSTLFALHILHNIWYIQLRHWTNPTRQCLEWKKINSITIYNIEFITCCLDLLGRDHKTKAEEVCHSPSRSRNYWRAR